MIYDFIEKVINTINRIFEDRRLSEEEKKEKIRETVSNAIWHVKLISFGKEEDEDS